MPTYEYACKECGHAFEQFQSFSDDALTDCPECNGRLRKVFNAVGVVFKGSGFYRTDSRTGTTATVPAASSESSTPSSDSSSKPSAADGPKTSTPAKKTTSGTPAKNTSSTSPS